MALWYQKGRVRLYQDQNKLFDLPKAFTFQGVKMDRIRFEDGAAMVTNIRIAVGAPDMRNKLLTEGKLVTYGIYFDVNKDVVKPESYSTLKSIAAILTENPDVKIKIVVILTATELMQQTLIFPNAGEPLLKMNW